MSRADSQARTRQRLLDAAGKVFAKRGYTAATVEEISDIAGYTRGAFYANFTDKASIFFTIVEAQQQLDFKDLAERIQGSSDQQILDAMYHWFMRTLVEAPLARAKSEFRLAAQDEPKWRNRLARLEQADIDLSANLLAQYCEKTNTKLTIQPAEFAGMVTALINGYAARIQLNPKGVAPQEIACALQALWTSLT